MLVWRAVAKGTAGAASSCCSQLRLAPWAPPILSLALLLFILLLAATAAEWVSPQRVLFTFQSPVLEAVRHFFEQRTTRLC